MSISEAIRNCDFFIFHEPVFGVLDTFALMICNIVPAKVDSTPIIISGYIYFIPAFWLHPVANQRHHSVRVLATVQRIINICF